MTLDPWHPVPNQVADGIQFSLGDEWLNSINGGRGERPVFCPPMANGVLPELVQPPGLLLKTDVEFASFLSSACMYFT